MITTHSLTLINTPELYGAVVYPTSGPESSGAIAGYYAESCFVPRQIHSSDVCLVTSITQERVEADAVITFSEGIPIGVVTADCVPILLYAPDIKGVAAVHAGWKGTLWGVAEKTLTEFLRRGAKPELTQVYFGPSISKDVYEVDETLAEKFAEAGFEDYIHFPHGPSSKPHLDLQRINAFRLERMGLAKPNIHLSSLCTFSSTDGAGKPLLPSHRRSGGSPSRLLTMIKLKS